MSECEMIYSPELSATLYQNPLHSPSAYRTNHKTWMEGHNAVSPPDGADEAASKDCSFCLPGPTWLSLCFVTFSREFDLAHIFRSSSGDPATNIIFTWDTRGNLWRPRLIRKITYDRMTMRECEVKFESARCERIVPLAVRLCICG